MSIQKFLYKRRGFLAGLATLAFLGVLALGVMRLTNYTLPLFVGEPIVAAESSSGETALAYYDSAYEKYRARDFDLAIQIATTAYSTLASETGSISSDQRVQKQAAEMQFLIGLCRDHNKQKSQAIDAYEQALRHNPDHLAAKYNLERLTRQPPPSGGGNGNGSGGGGAGGAGDGAGAPGDGKQPGQQPGGGASHQGKKGI